MSKGLASINVKFSVDLKQFSTEMQNAARQLDRFGKQMTQIGQSMSVFVTAPLLAAGAASVKLASDFQESLNKVDVAFGSTAGQVKNFAQQALTQFGIAEGTALDMAATFGDMATSMGLPQAEAANMSTSLVGLAGDLASFKNIGIDQAMTALNGVFTGETESLKMLGVVMTEANLQAFALSKGIKTQVKDMDQASKVNLRYAYIMEMTKNAQGDFARTGGGAANQMRIFQESMKQLGQQFGAVILPHFTKLITGLNGMISGFSKLSDGTKTTIVIFAALAAAAGPMLIIIGQMAQGIPVLISAFGKLKAAMVALNLSPNPYVLLATAIAAIGIALYTWYSNTKQMVTAKQALNDAVARGNKEAVNEVVALDRLYKSATSTVNSMQDRKKAVDELQSRFPAYFKNISDEAILNGKAAAAYLQVRDAIFAKSRASAIQKELDERANQRLEKEIKLREDIARTRAEIKRIDQGPDQTVLDQGSAMDKTVRVTITKAESLRAQMKLLAMQKAELNKLGQDALREDAVLLDAKIENERKSAQLTQDQTTNNFNLTDSINTVTDAEKNRAKAGTIAFYENLIKGLQQQQREVATTRDRWVVLQDAIDEYQKKIDAISGGKVVLSKPVMEGEVGAPMPFDTPTIDSLNDEKAYYEGLRSALSTTNAEYGRYSEAIERIQMQINEITGDSSLPRWVQGVGDSVTEVTAQMVDISTAFSEVVLANVQSMISGFAEGIGQLMAGVSNIGDVGSFILESIGDLIIQLGKAAVQIGVGMLAIKKAFVTPFGAIAAGVAMIAFGALLKSSLPKFADGGIVGGTSYYGDKILARVNSGEMIANDKQQARIWAAMNAGSAPAVAVLSGDFKIKGNDLELVLNRTKEKKNRMG